VPARQAAIVNINVSFAPLAQWDPKARRRVLPAAAEITFEVGSYAHDPAALAVRVRSGAAR